MELLDRLFGQKQEHKNIVLFFDFKKKVPYPSQVTKVRNVEKALQEAGFCKRATAVRRLSEDKQFMVALEIHCFGINFEKKDDFEELVKKALFFFNDYGIAAAFNAEKSFFFDKGTDPFFKDVTLEGVGK